MNKKSVILLLIFVTLLTSCLPSKEIESLGIINTRGIDILDDGSLETTILFFQFDAESKNITKIISGTGETIKGARANANFKTNFELTPGQIRMEIYGMESAKKGILPYIDTLVRDAKVADTMFLAVSKSKAKDLIKPVGKSSKYGGRYLYRLIEQTVNDDIIPRMTLQDFNHIYYDVGIDPILPMLKIQDERPYLYAMAVFKGDKYVGKIPTEDGFLLNMLKKTVETTLLELEIPIKPFKKYLAKTKSKKKDKKTFHVLLSVLKGKGNIDVLDMSNLSFDTDIKVRLRLLELAKEVKLDKPKVMALLEKEIEKNLERQYSDLLAKTQELNADPFGFGSVYRSHKQSGELKTKTWRNMFPDIKVNFHVDAKIVRHGITR